ncbi:hypothetical protein KIW84_020840 [Lathyrus oleraceus]|uniref:Uncharacterized protein n=1 Tax=Pisum sativum TaxID=3888 RepID=A0A9D4Y897_PEA|nr:hypothetical protein KIW84_020840 [Pisum sativum]
MYRFGSLLSSNASSADERDNPMTPPDLIGLCSSVEEGFILNTWLSQVSPGLSMPLFRLVCCRLCLAFYCLLQIQVHDMVDGCGQGCKHVDCRLHWFIAARLLMLHVARPRCLPRFAFASSLHLLQACFGRFVFSGWRIRHSLYHCKLVMYGSQKNWNSGQKFMVLKILGQMFKHGYTVPNQAFPS